MRKRHNKKHRVASQNRGFADDLVGPLQRFNARLKAGLVDTKAPAFYAVMACVVQLGMHRLSKRLEAGTVDIHSVKYQNFLHALGKLSSTPERRGQPEVRRLMLGSR